MSCEKPVIVDFGSMAEHTYRSESFNSIAAAIQQGRL
jgi:hypothetical protein